MRENTLQDPTVLPNDEQLQNRVQFLQDSLKGKEQEVTEYQRVISEKLQAIFQMQELQQELKQSLDDSEAHLNGKRTEVMNIQNRIQQVYAQIEALQNQLSFRREYEARHEYYKSFQAAISEPTVMELQQLINGYEHIIISPETLPLCQNRIRSLFAYAAGQGFLCIECVPVQAGEGFVLEQVAPHYYRIKMEGYLIPVLQHQHVTVLTTWVLQKAWYDLLPQVSIWYDLSTDRKYLFGADPEMSLEHWGRLEQATVITYADEAQKELTYYRKDALLLQEDANERVKHLLFERLTSREMTQEGSLAR